MLERPEHRGSGFQVDGGSHRTDKDEEQQTRQD
jgi:hypothetical protein